MNLVNEKCNMALTLLCSIGMQRKSTCTLAEHADIANVSVSYAERIMKLLKVAGIVTARRGPGGEYRLARSADDITLGQVVRALELTPRNPLELLVHRSIDSMTLADYVQFAGYPVDNSVVSRWSSHAMSCV